MRKRSIVTIAIFVAVLLSVGYLHIPRNVDLVSKFNLENTARIVVKREVGSAPLEVTDPADIRVILADLRRSRRARWLKYKEMGAIAFVDTRGRELAVGLYGSEPGLILRKDNRFFRFRGKLVDMILERREEG